MSEVGARIYSKHYWYRETDQEDHGEGNETDSEQGVDEVDAETRVVESWGSGQW